MRSRDVEIDFASDVQGRVEHIIETLGLGHINQFRIISMRSKGAKANAYARIWNLPRIWQKALGVQPYYIIEVLSESFDHLPEPERDRILIHELTHIPKTFSGALVPHLCFGKRIDRGAVDKVYQVFKRQEQAKVDG